MEIWNEIQPHILEIITAIGMIIAITKTRYKKSVVEKVKEKLDKAHDKSVKKEKELKSAYEKEAELQKEYDHVTSK